MSAIAKFAGAFALSDLLNVRRISKVIEDIQDVRGTILTPWANRVNNVPADEDELIAKITTRIVAADVIVDDGKARVRSSDPIRMTQTKIPNLKLGINLNQKRLNVLWRLVSGGAMPSDLKSMDTYLSQSLMAILEGVKVRKTALVCAMLADDSSYNKFGIQWSGQTWGMPSDLKVQLATGRRWIAGNESTAKPVTDINAILTLATQKYGIKYDRLTMSMTLLQFICTTDEFRAVASVYFAMNSLPAAMNFGAMQPNDLTGIVGRILGLTIEIDDFVYWEEAEDASLSSSRFFNALDVIFTSSQYDNANGIWDFANAVVTESLLGALGKSESIVGGISGPTEGPLGYATVPDDLNPPNLTLWGVQRGFPRKHIETASARLRTS